MEACVEQLLFEQLFILFFQFFSRWSEEFDAVILIRIMGGRDDDADIKAALACQIGYARRSDHPGRRDIRSPCPQTCCERSLYPVARLARVSPYQCVAGT